MTRPRTLALLAISLILIVACGATASEESPPPATPTSTAVAPQPSLSPEPAPTPGLGPTPSPTPTPQKVEPHIPMPPSTPAPQPTSTSPPPTPDAGNDDGLPPELEGLLTVSSQVSELRGLAVLQDPPVGFITSQEMERRVQENIAKEYTPEEAAQDYELYLALDFVEEGIDLIQVTAELYGGAVIGFYDTDEKELFVLSEGEGLGPDEKVTLAHELVHALQDQHFDLDSFLPEDEENTDLERAKVALVEGDATLSMSTYALEHLSLQELLSLGDSSDSDSPLASAPRILQEDLSFPYTTGLNFVRRIFGGGGWAAVDRAFANPPQSTEQIMHPEKYVSGDDPLGVELPELAGSLGPTWETLDTGVMGEFLLKVYLENFVRLGQAARAAAGWGGDSYAVLKDTSTGERMLVSLSAWDTIPDAQEFFDAYLTYVDGKGDGTWQLRAVEDTVRWWDQSGDSVYLSIAEDRVLLIIGQSGQSIEKALPAFPGF